jgi:hypothetical protein
LVFSSKSNKPGPSGIAMTRNGQVGKVIEMMQANIDKVLEHESVNPNHISGSTGLSHHHHHHHGHHHRERRCRIFLATILISGILVMVGLAIAYVDWNELILPIDETNSTSSTTTMTPNIVDDETTFMSI